MLVTHDLFDGVLKKFEQAGIYGLDTETTGLEESDRLFAIIISDASQGYYFHFEEKTPGAETLALPRSFLDEFIPVFANPASTWMIHNAKFDLRMLEKEGLTIAGKIHCSQVTARLLKNDHFDYSLDACAKRIGLEKDKAVEAYIKENKLYESYEVPGKKLKKTRKFFDRVPLPLMAKYGENDARLHRALGLSQLEELKDKPNVPSLKTLYENEHQLIRVCMDMERVGIKIDRPYVQKALEFETQTVENLKVDFEKETGKPFIDSGKALKEIFTAKGVPLSFTEKGNASFAYEVLKEMNSPLAKLITEIRTHAMYAQTYYSSFLYFADDSDVIHPSMRQDATQTGRFSYHEPNLQNVPKEDEEILPYYVRRSYVPRPGFCFVPIDYKQQEFKMLLDYAGEKEIIEEILAGKDVHQATADQMGVSRKHAKTLNFGILYGMGVEKLARALSVSVPEATDLRNNFFLKLPRVRYLTRQIINTGKTRGYIWNWFGRRCYISHPDYAYVLVNHLIQGGCADVVKVAMVQVHEFLRPYKSRMVTQVHDELLFEIHETEFHLIEPIKAIMENVYKPFHGLPLTCSVDHSWKSWAFADKVEGLPNEEARNQIQGTIRREASGHSQKLLAQNSNA